MADKESEATFNSLNLDPQTFINEVFNSVEDLLEDAFEHFHLEASELLNTDATSRAQDLEKGINHTKYAIQDSLEKKYSMLEMYWLHHVFTVPSGFFIPPEDESSDYDLIDQDKLSNEQVDAQLDSLRNSLEEAEKECAELEAELNGLERNSVLSNKYISSVNEILQMYEKSSAHEMFQELMKVGSELHSNFEQLKSKKMEAMECNWRELRISNTNGDMPELNFGGALSKVGQDELQYFLAKLKSKNLGVHTA